MAAKRAVVEDEEFELEEEDLDPAGDEDEEDAPKAKAKKAKRSDDDDSDEDSKPAKTAKKVKAKAAEEEEEIEDEDDSETKKKSVKAKASSKPVKKSKADADEAEDEDTGRKGKKMATTEKKAVAGKAKKPRKTMYGWKRGEWDTPFKPGTMMHKVFKAAQKGATVKALKKIVEDNCQGKKPSYWPISDLRSGTFHGATWRLVEKNGIVKAVDLEMVA